MSEPLIKIPQKIEDFLFALQEQVTEWLVSYEGDKKSVCCNPWESERGRGEVRILENGNFFNKAGVNVSIVHGGELPAAATARKPELQGIPFVVAGISIVIHPDNPFIPTSHANVRVFMGKNKQGEVIWWFGGGFDLTPYYANVQDCCLWHKHAYLACKPFGDLLYGEFKKQCDDYFYLSHRKESRGIGGIFFDDLQLESIDNTFLFMQSVANNYFAAYKKIVVSRKDNKFTQQQKDFQEYRRGRYVEFNLLYDRGTRFGLQWEHARTEAVLMSLPSTAQWKYDYKAEKGSEEEKLTSYYLQPKDWLSIKEKELDE